MAAKRKRAMYLSPQQHWVLNQACQPISAAYGNVWLVGSVLERPDYRDVDVRCMLYDEVYAALFPDDPPESPNAASWARFSSRIALLNTVISEHLIRVTGLPVDFQFQQVSAANAAYPGPRNLLGVVR